MTKCTHEQSAKCMFCGKELHEILKEATLAENRRVLDEIMKIDILNFEIQKGMPCLECGSRNSAMYIGEREAQSEGEDSGSAYMCVKCHPIAFLKEIKRTLKDELASLHLKRG